MTRLRSGLLASTALSGPVAPALLPPMTERDLQAVQHFLPLAMLVGMWPPAREGRG